MSSSRKPSRRSATRSKLAAPILEALEERRLMSFYYVSPTGNDNSAGTSTTKPFKTLAKLNTINFQAGDTICLLAGATFAGRIYFDANDKGTLVNPIKVTNWNAGRATIDGQTSFGIYAYNTAGVVIENTNIKGAGATNTSAGIFFYNDRTDGAKLEGITINNVDVSGFKYGVEIGGGVNALGGSNTAGFRHVTVSNSALHDNIMAGMFTFGATYNVNEKIYVHHVKAYNNVGVAGYIGVSGQGIVLGNVNGALVERCEAYNNGAVGNGGAGIWAYDSTKVTFQFNESHHNRTGGPHDGDGFDLDQNVSNSVMQYNYSHDNDGAGFLMATKFNNTLHTNNIVRYNISQNDGRKLSYGALHIWGKVLNSEWYNNTVFLSPNSAGTTPAAVRIINDSIELQDVANVHFRNNIFQTTGSVPMVQVFAGQLNGAVDLRFENNDYFATGGTTKFIWGSTTHTSIGAWRTATGQEMRNGAAVGTTVNPMLTAPGTGGTIGNTDLLESSLGAYKLQSSSLIINAGLNLKTTFNHDMGTRDFWATVTPQYGAYDIGANESLFSGPVSPPPPPPPPPPPATQSPYNGTPVAITLAAPVTIEAENFDLGGQGVAYSDSEVTNFGGQYRPTEGVDIEATTGGYSLGYIKVGEWLEYTVNVTAGTYDLSALFASKGIGGTLHVEFGGVNKTGAIAVPDTAGWQTWANTASKRITLSGGVQVMRVYFDTNGGNGFVGNLNSIKLTPVAAAPISGPTVTLANSVGAYAHDGAASTNYGSASQLLVKKSTTGYNRESYLQFDLSSVSTITDSKLRLYGNLSDTTVASLTTAIYSSTNTSWNEGTVTWGSRPASAVQVGSVTVSGTAAGWYEIDLTAFLQAEKAAGRNTVTLVLRNTASSSAMTVFNSDDAATNRPELLITT